MNDLLNFNDVDKIVKENISINFCINQKNLSINKNFNDLEFVIKIENDFSIFELDISVFVKEFSEPFLKYNIEYMLSKKGVILNESISEMNIEYFNDNIPKVLDENLNEILFIYNDNFIYKVKKDIYASDFIFDGEDLSTKGYIKTNNTIECISQEDYLNKILSLKNNNFKSLIENSFKEIYLNLSYDKNKYDFILDSLIEDNEFVIMSINNSFDLLKKHLKVKTIELIDKYME